MFNPFEQRGPESRDAQILALFEYLQIPNSLEEIKLKHWNGNGEISILLTNPDGSVLAAAMLSSFYQEVHPVLVRSLQVEAKKYPFPIISYGISEIDLAEMNPDRIVGISEVTKCLTLMAGIDPGKFFVECSTNLARDPRKRLIYQRSFDNSNGLPNQEIAAEWFGNAFVEYGDNKGDISNFEVYKEKQEVKRTVILNNIGNDINRVKGLIL